MQTGFFFAERCFWHSGGNYALTLPVGDLVQPLAAGGLPESPETKRRFKNLAEVTGLLAQLAQRSADPATWQDLLRVHPESYLQAFKSLSAGSGGELGLRTPFGKGGFEIAALSAGLVKQAVLDVAEGRLHNAYALSRPPGHHCLPDFPNGFCLMANIPIALEAARVAGLVDRVVVLDWDVHHGNGTEAIYLDRPDTLTISLHQERNYPIDTGAFETRGEGAGKGFNINLPLPPGVGHEGYLYAMRQIVLPAIEQFAPDLIVVACGFDASAFDPLGRMLCTADTFRQMTEMTARLASSVCEGRLVMVHEGGYSEAYVPFCGHATLEALSGLPIRAEDPMGAVLSQRQPGPDFDGFVAGRIDAMAAQIDWQALKLS